MFRLSSAAVATSREGHRQQICDYSSHCSRWPSLLPSCSGIAPYCMNDPQPEGHMASHIGRRKFLATLGGAAAAWPLAARAQQQPMPVIGFLSSGQPQVFAHMIDAFRQGLNETGYVVGQNVAFEHRAAGSEYDRFRVMADDLVRRQVG